MAKEQGAPEQFLTTFRGMKRELEAGKKALFSQEMAIVNRNTLLEQVKFLEGILPVTIEQAAEVVKEQDAMLERIQNEGEQILAEAKAKAKDMEDSANAMLADAETRARNGLEQAINQARQTEEEANQKANAIVEAARMEAQRIVEDADKKAYAMTQKEEILRRAKDESEKLTEKARQEMAQLRQNTLNYVDGQLAEVDRSLSALIEGIRMERNEVRNRR